MPATIFAGLLGGGLFLSTDAGASWISLLRNSSVSAVAIANSNPSIIYAAVGSGVFKSIDGGNQWAATAVGPTLIQVLVIDPTNPETVYVGSNLVDGSSVFRILALENRPGGHNLRSI